MLDVGCPDPALVEERIESTRSCAASSATVSRPIVESCSVVDIRPLPSFTFDHRSFPAKSAPHPSQAMPCLVLRWTPRGMQSPTRRNGANRRRRRRRQPEDEVGAELSKLAMPTWVEPQLATLTRERFSSPEWIFERKLDGERCLAFADSGGVRLLSRSQHDITRTFPEIAAALAAQHHGDVVVDGEIVAFDGTET